MYTILYNLSVKMSSNIYIYIYSDGDNIIIIVFIIGVLGLSWFCVGYVGITIVALVFRW